MSSILDENFINGCPEEEFALLIAAFMQNRTEETHKALYDFAFSHFRKLDRKMCWKKYHYIGIINPTAYKQSQNSWRKCELTAILASEIYKRGNLGWPRCKVFKATGRGPKERRCQWFEIHRDQDNPILSSGWKFSNYDIFEVPEEFFAFAYDFLPKQSKTD